MRTHSGSSFDKVNQAAYIWNLRYCSSQGFYFRLRIRHVPYNSSPVLPPTRLQVPSSLCFTVSLPIRKESADQWIWWSKLFFLLRRDCTQTFSRPVLSLKSILPFQSSVFVFCVTELPLWLLVHCYVSSSFSISFPLVNVVCSQKWSIIKDQSSSMQDSCCVYFLTLRWISRTHIWFLRRFLFPGKKEPKLLHQYTAFRQFNLFLRNNTNFTLRQRWRWRCRGGDERMKKRKKERIGK